MYILSLFLEKYQTIWKLLNVEGKIIIKLHLILLMTSFYLRTEEFAVCISLLAWQFVFCVYSGPLGTTSVPLLNSYIIKNSPYTYPVSVTMFPKGYHPYIQVWNILNPIFLLATYHLYCKEKRKYCTWFAT